MITLLIIVVISIVVYALYMGHEQSKYEQEGLSMSSEEKSYKTNILKSSLMDYYLNKGDNQTAKDIQSDRYNYRQLKGLERSVSMKTESSIVSKFGFSLLAIVSSALLLWVLTQVFVGDHPTESIQYKTMMRRISNQLIPPLMVSLLIVIWANKRVKVVFLSSFGLFFSIKAVLGLIWNNMQIVSSATSTRNILGSLLILGLGLTFLYMAYDLIKHWSSWRKSVTESKESESLNSKTEVTQPRKEKKIEVQTNERSTPMNSVGGSSRNLTEKERQRDIQKAFPSGPSAERLNKLHLERLELENRLQALDEKSKIVEEELKREKYGNLYELGEEVIHVLERIKTRNALDDRLEVFRHFMKYISENTMTQSFREEYPSVSESILSNMFGNNAFLNLQKRYEDSPDEWEVIKGKMYKFLLDE